MLIASLVLTAEVTLMGWYRLSALRRNPQLPGLMDFSWIHALIAFCAAVVGFALVRGQDWTWTTVAGLGFLGGFIPAQAGLACAALSQARWLPPVVALVGGLAMGTENPDALLPWS
ncbi:hypothetical protein AB0D11_44760 [Streptomyces monashensis]|uniref:hypothetical protein n=1 Tax=Streptomyces monashensis TaxID=1678012 RepID=UPI0033EDCD17